jgi:hypothetical protein
MVGDVPPGTDAWSQCLDAGWSYARERCTTVTPEISMLTTLEVFIYAAVLFLFPMIVFSIVKGSPPPPSNFPFVRYYHVEKYLSLAGNLFVLSICFLAAARLALHFGVIDAAMSDSMEWITHVPFMALFFIYIAMWIRAAIKVRRAEKPQA